MIAENERGAEHPSMSLTPVWTEDVADDGSVAEARRMAAKYRDIDPFARPVDIGFVTFGLKMTAGSSREWSLVSISPDAQRKAVGVAVCRPMSARRDQSRGCTAVLFNDGTTYELVGRKDERRRIDAFSNGTAIANIVELEASEPRTWWTKFLKSFVEPRRWVVSTPLDGDGTVLLPAIVRRPTGRTTISFDEIALPVQLSRRARFDLPGQVVDYRSPLALSHENLVIPWGTPPLDDEMLRLLFIVNIAFRIHIFHMDFAD